MAFPATFAERLLFGACARPAGRHAEPMEIRASRVLFWGKDDMADLASVPGLALAVEVEQAPGYGSRVGRSNAADRDAAARRRRGRACAVARWREACRRCLSAGPATAHPARICGVQRCPHSEVQRRALITDYGDELILRRAGRAHQVLPRAHVSETIRDALGKGQRREMGRDWEMGDVGSPPRARPRRFVLKSYPRTWLSHFANEALVCGDCMTNAPHEERSVPIIAAQLHDE